jgi:hypothetical protein
MVRLGGGAWPRETPGAARSGPLTGVLITFVSFADYARAERHKAELEAIADPLGRTSVVAIESLPSAELPKMKPELKNGAASARRPK